LKFLLIGRPAEEARSIHMQMQPFTNGGKSLKVSRRRLYFLVLLRLLALLPQPFLDLLLARAVATIAASGSAHCSYPFPLLIEQHAEDARSIPIDCGVRRHRT
jgi:hypothetical protein